MKKLVVFTFFICFSFLVFSAEKRDILQKEADEIGLAETLIKGFSELNFPAYKNRDFWDHLPQTLRQQYIRQAEKYLTYDWPAVKATDYLEIIRSGDRRQEVYAAPFGALQALVMGELVEGKGRFIDQIVNGAWFYSEQTWWGWSAHLTLQKAPHGLPDVNEPVIDLGVGETANVLSWTWFLFKEEFDKIHPLISKRLKDEIMKKAVIPYYERDDFWWMGLKGDRSVNNWNPWTNHNMLTAILILEDNREQKIKGVQKVIRSLDVFLNGYPDDGGCDEGPSYWGRAGGSFYQCLDLLKRATNGKFNVYDYPLIKNIGSYIYKVYIDYPYFVNFADADAISGSRPFIIYSYGKEIGDPILQKFGAFLAKKQGWGEKKPDEKVDEQIMQLMHLEEIANAPAENALISHFWLSDLQIGGGRDQAGSSQGFFFAAKGGHNAESHNHNDVGSFVMYYNGKPCLIDLGRETYTAKTFSDRRYEIWTMQSQYHNLPKINGFDQLPGREYKATGTQFKANAGQILFSTDISKAYPPEAEVRKWERIYRLDRGKQFIIRDVYALNKISDNPATLNFIAYCKVSQVKPGIIRLRSSDYDLEMRYDPQSVSPTIEFIEITDKGLKRYWPEGVTRIVFTFDIQRTQGKNKITILPSHN
jgi:hypothetical protein